MSISERNLRNNLIGSFAYHDAKILKLEENGKDVTMIFTDGWVEGQIDQIIFTNCKIKYQYDFVGSEIYQLDGIYKDETSKWYMSFLIWIDGDLLEKVEVEAENIISKEYQIKDSVRDEIKEENNTIFEELKQLINQMGINNIEKLKSKEYKSAENKILSTRKKDVMMEDFDNYVLVSEEDLNQEIYGK